MPALVRRRGTARWRSAPSRSGRSQASGVASGSAGVGRGAGRRPGARASAITRCPPATSVSLLAVATTLPARSAASVGRSDTTPPVPTITRSTSSRVASSTQRVLAPDAGHARRAGRGATASSARATAAGREAPGLRLELRGVAAGGQGDDLEPVGVGLEDVDRLAADAPGRAQQRDADAPAVSEPARRHTARRLGPRTGTSRSGRACRRGPGSGSRSPSPRRPA